MRFAPADRAFLAALLTSLPREVPRRLLLLVRPDTVLRWHRDLMKRRHAHTCRPKRPGRPPTVRSTRALILRLVRENPAWGYRRLHGELTTLGIKVAPSTVWEILKQEGLDLAPATAPSRSTSPPMMRAWAPQPRRPRSSPMEVPEIDVIWTGIPDPHAPMGVRGIGELSMTGTAAAIANAIYNATGKRIRELPITLPA